MKTKGLKGMCIYRGLDFIFVIFTYCRFHWVPSRYFVLEIKAKFANKVWTEKEGTSPAGAVVSNRENKRGVIKAFIVFSRSGHGT